MAHQAHAIPWQTLADKLKYMHCSPRNHDITNLYLRKTKDKNQGRQLQYFVKGFTRALKEYSGIERGKYDKEPTVPDQHEIVISDDAVSKMSKTLRGYKSNAISKSLAELLSPWERSMQRFIRDTETGEGDMFPGAFEACELTKILIMYGEMSTLLRLAAHPKVHFYRLWHEDEYANSNGYGVHKLLQSTLQAYICLNTLVIRSELYDRTVREHFVKKEGDIKSSKPRYEEGAYDYRSTAAYQRMLLTCTAMSMPFENEHETHTYPHREFFGIPRGMVRFDNYRWRMHLGTQTVAELAHHTFRDVHVPSRSDIPAVLGILREKGLPAELALQIMDVAKYVPVGRLRVRDNPLHKENAEELKKYLSYCWKLLVRIDMIIWNREGKALNWEAEVTDTLYVLFDMPSHSLFETTCDESGRLCRRLTDGSY